MMAFRSSIRILFSLSTALWLLVLVLAMFLAGAFIMPGTKEFQSIHSMPMFDWLTRQPFTVTWWLWCSICVLAILAVNTLLCSVESIMKKRKITQWLLLISPQIIHAGFLFILLAHLLSAAGASQGLRVAGEGSRIDLFQDDALLVVERIRIRTNSRGYVSDWSVQARYVIDGETVSRERIEPNKPFLRRGLNVIVKDLRAYPHKAVLFQVSREPGAFWALLGGMLSVAGIVTLIILRIRAEK
jgi:cytochrome c biogenesis protein ResB